MKRLLVALGFVLAFGATTKADDVFVFEDPPYSLGALAGQDGWVSVDGIVTDADSTEGSQSVIPSLTGMSSRVLSATLLPTDAYRITADVRLAGANTGYLGLSSGDPTPDFLTVADKVLEWGWDPSGFYAHGPDQYEIEGSWPDSDRWVTVWGEFYDAGGGDLRANLGWCEVSETPFVDGLRIADYNVGDRNSVYLGIRGPAYFDNISVVSESQLIPGDFNMDGVVDVSDLGILATNYGATGMSWEQGDANGDGAVDVSDLGILATNYGTGTAAAAVPEPNTTALLLLLGALGFGVGRRSPRFD